ncbi:MAG: OsmC family protein, partial [Nitrospirota bacterium]|nr:OsmC family protein [Nitrospirota bacterium]
MINNINTDAVLRFIDDVQKDPAKAKKTKRVEGEWTLVKGQPQFRARVEYPSGADTLEADTAPFMGGTGIKPDPVQYCLFGLAACYASTFAAIAAGEGVVLAKLVVAAENLVDLSRSIGVSSNPIVEGVTITATV